MPELLTNAFQSLSTQIAPALAEVMETMAFLCAIPLAEPATDQPPPSDAVRLTMSFTGPISGVVEMMTSERLGRLINENMLASDAIDTEQTRRDALLELMNMTCGTLFHHASEQAGKSFSIGLPQLQPCNSDSQWVDFILQPGVTFLDVEGLTVGVHVFASGSR